MNRVAAAVAAASVVVMSACGDGDLGAEGSGFPPTEVTVVTVTPLILPETFEFSGEVVPYRRVEVRAQVSGIILERRFVEGQMVQEGQVLYQLERDHHEAASRGALARVEAARRRLDRMEPILAANAVAQQEVDDARSELGGALAAAEQAQKDLKDATMRAGLTGRVGRALMDVGARVSGPAELLTIIERLDPVHVSFRPSSQQQLAWQKDVSSRRLIQPGGGLTVEVTLPDGSLLPRSGRIDFAAPTLDAETGTREFRALFPNPDLLLMPGQFVRVHLSGFTRENSLAVPLRAVQTGMGRQFVYVVGPGDTAQVRDVETGPWSGDQWIILGGLRPGDRVIVDGLQKVIPGQPVKTGPGSAPPPAAPENGGAPDSSPTAPDARPESGGAP
jgi:membrane fusion protein (multidrug efflux system)